ncbi:hypothetical protein ACFOZ9_10790 [Deinococcus navajonensis]|uniref:Uncharacterized protein n=1 Tax=Deinococcus navajonensis TaxID=309884 RepID=A0ABV8XSA1_9DEIO
MLQQLTHDLQEGTRPALLRAGRRAYGLAFVALGFPGLPLGLAHLLTGPAPLPFWAPLVLAILGVALAAVALRLAGQAARDSTVSAGRAALTAAIQAAAAPGTMFLLGCGLLADVRGLALLWALTLVTAWTGWRQLAGWVRDPQAASSPA